MRLISAVSGVQIPPPLPGYKIRKHKIYEKQDRIKILLLNLFNLLLRLKKLPQCCNADHAGTYKKHCSRFRDRCRRVDRVWRTKRIYMATPIIIGELLPLGRHVKDHVAPRGGFEHICRIAIVGLRV